MEKAPDPEKAPDIEKAPDPEKAPVKEKNPPVIDRSTLGSGITFSTVHPVSEQLVINSVDKSHHYFQFLDALEMSHFY